MNVYVTTKTSIIVITNVKEQANIFENTCMLKILCLPLHCLLEKDTAKLTY